MKTEEPNFNKILQAKKAVYGECDAAYENAAESYARKFHAYYSELETPSPSHAAQDRVEAKEALSHILKIGASLLTTGISGDVEEWKLPKSTPESVKRKIEAEADRWNENYRLKAIQLKAAHDVLSKLLASQPLPAQDKTPEGEDCPYCGYFKPCSNCLAKKEQAASTTPTPEGEEKLHMMIEEEDGKFYVSIENQFESHFAANMFCEKLNNSFNAYFPTPEGRTAEEVLSWHLSEREPILTSTEYKIAALAAMEEYASSRPTQQSHSLSRK